MERMSPGMTEGGIGDLQVWSAALSLHMWHARPRGSATGTGIRPVIGGPPEGPQSCDTRAAVSPVLAAAEKTL